MGRLQKRSLFSGGVYFFLCLEMILKQFWTIKYSKTVKYFDDLKQFTAFKVANMHYYLNPHLTLIERGSWILLESGGAESAHTFYITSKHSEKSKKKFLII